MSTADASDVASDEFAGKNQLRRYGQFLQRFSERLSLTCEHFQHSDLENWPVLLDFKPFEKGPLADFVDSGNPAFDKIVTALLAICLECERLEKIASTKFYPILLAYGEFERDGEVSDAERLKTVAEFLPSLQDLSLFVERCCDVVRNLVHQLAGLYQNKSKSLDAKEVRFSTVFEKLVDVLTILINIDEIIEHNSVLKEHWNLYTKTLHLIRHNPEKFDTDAVHLKPLDNVCQKLDAQIMSGFVFQNCVEQPFDSDEIYVSQKGALLLEFIAEIKRNIQNIELQKDLFGRSKLVGVCGLYVLYFSIYRTLDAKPFKSLCELYKKFPCLTLIGDILWCPVNFLAKKLPEFVDKKLTQAAPLERNAYLQNLVVNLPRDTQNYVLSVSDWCSAMSTLNSLPQNIHTELDRRSNLIFRGLKMAASIKETLKAIFNGRLKRNDVALTSTTIECLFRRIELLKIIEETFFRRWIVVCESASHIRQRTVGFLLKSFVVAKDTIRADKQYSGRKLDALSALSLVESALIGAQTDERAILLKISLNVVGGGKILKHDEIVSTVQIFEKMQILLNLDESVRSFCDCSFLAHHRSIVPIYFDKIRSHCAEAGRVNYFFNALNDVASFFRRSSEKSLASFENETLETFHVEFLEKLEEVIENDLRISIHTNLQLDKRNPFANEAPQNVDGFLSLPPLRLGRLYVDIKRSVEKYLEKTFYNLTTVALHDWKTYGEMRQLANRRYGLVLIEPHLPSQTLEQGLDTLEIMRNIHIFVSKYLYNLNDQIFMESSSNSKHLNTLSIGHVANSIRTHGVGIMNTTVNFTYQFLRKKFYIFSQFLFDDHVKARLTKDSRYFRDHKEQLNGMYPFEKAEKFNRGMRKLGFAADGSSYFDQFRRLITEIGNALGYVRLVRAGGLQSCSRSIQFVPDLEDVVNLAPLCELSSETNKSASVFDSLLNDLIRNFEEGTEYFKLLVDVFSGEFRNPKHVHLRNFYVVVPALTVNFVEHLINCKERLTKKSRDGAAFTDDGFAMGVAYVLKLLDQYNEFDSLHWFASIATKHAKDKADVSKQQIGSATATDEKLQHTLTLTRKRIEQYGKEFELVNFALRSARIFFRTDVDAELIPKDKEPVDNSDAASGKSGSVPEK